MQTCRRSLPRSLGGTRVARWGGTGVARSGAGEGLAWLAAELGKNDATREHERGTLFVTVVMLPTLSLVEGMLQWVENCKPESNLLKRQVPNVSNQNLEDEKKFLSVKRKERRLQTNHKHSYAFPQSFSNSCIV